MRKQIIVFIALCGVMTVCCQRGRDFDDDFDDYRGFGPGGYGPGGYGRQRETQCPKQTKQNEFCKPIPNGGREEYRNERAISEFSWSLFKNANTQRNYALSPISPQILLSYLAWTSDGSTKQEIVKAAKISNPSSIERTVSSLKYTTNYKGQPRKILDVATAFFVADDLKLNSAFTSKAAENIDIKKINFADEGQVNEVFNTWMKEKTRGTMKVDANFSPSTKLSLVSTIYFKAKWQFEFPEPVDHDFTTLEGEKIQVPMMSLQNREFNYGLIGEDAEWLAIPYRSEESLVIILPNKTKTLDEVINNMNEKAFVDLMYQVEKDDNEVKVNLTIPKFKLETSSDLIAPLQKMGINKLFSASPNLSYMVDSSVQVSEVRQQTSIDVNEEGSILVSSTMFHFVALSVARRHERKTFVVDRPFIAMIVHNSQNLPYVICKVTDPKY